MPKFYPVRGSKNKTKTKTKNPQNPRGFENTPLIGAVRKVSGGPAAGQTDRNLGERSRGMGTGRLLPPKKTFILLNSLRPLWTWSGGKRTRPTVLTSRLTGNFSYCVRILTHHGQDKIVHFIIALMVSSCSLSGL